MDDPEDEEELESVLPCWKLAQYFKDKLPENYILGWDYGRAATVVRWGYTVGYINEEDSWTWLDPVSYTHLDLRGQVSAYESRFSDCDRFGGKCRRSDRHGRSVRQRERAAHTYRSVQARHDVD